MAKRRTSSGSLNAGPARKYRRGPERYEAVRHLSSKGQIPTVTRIGCRDAAVGRKDPYKPEARGFIAAYREGYRICDLIGRKNGWSRLSNEDKRVAGKLELIHVRDRALWSEKHRRR